MEPILRVKDLWKVFAPKGVSVDTGDPASLKAAEEQGAVVAVRDVTLDVDPGELFVVMGLSGSGKSTFIRCLIRLVEPTSGRILVEGEDVTALDDRGLTEFRRSKMAMVFQHYGLLPHKTVLENAAFGLKLQGVPKEEREERARQALDQVGLAGWEDRHPAALSGGMQQRVGIARALAKDPTILLMDEPFSGLDPLIRRDMQEELARLQDEVEKTIIFITHDLDEAIRLGDRMAVMHSGSFVQVAEPDEILENPADDYVARFVEGERLRRKKRAGAPAGTNGQGSTGSVKEIAAGAGKRPASGSPAS